MSDTNDKELLELAAKAAGVALVPCTCSDDRWPFKYNEAIMRKFGHWNPLVDDGHALRLAVKLGLCVTFGANYILVNGNQVPTVNNVNDPYLATRRAITGAAAEIGRNMT